MGQLSQVLGHMHDLRPQACLPHTVTALLTLLRSGYALGSRESTQHAHHPTQKLAVLHIAVERQPTRIPAEALFEPAVRDGGELLRTMAAGNGSVVVWPRQTQVWCLASFYIFVQHSSIYPMHASHRRE